MSDPEPGTVHIISVGLSLFGNAAGGSKEISDRSGVEQAVAARIKSGKRGITDEKNRFPNADDERKRQAAWLSAVTRAGSDERAGLGELLSEVSVDQWKPGLSAELTALATSLKRSDSPKRPEASERAGDAGGDAGDSMLPPRDTAVLIASDTGPGLRAALFNAAAMVGGDLNRVRYMHEPSPDVASMQGKAVVVRLPGLDAGETEGFTEAMRGLGDVGAGVSALLKPEKAVARLHLSGGFKAAVPFLLGLGEGLRSLHDSLKVEALIVHESSRDKAGGPEAIPLPLRSFSPELLKKQLAGVADDGLFTTLPPDGQPLDGFAYQRGDDREWRLTPFGHALHRLLHRRPREP